MSFTADDLKNLLRSAREPQPQDELGFERSLTDNALRSLGTVQTPSDLSLRIRLALSHERARAERSRMRRAMDAVELFFENTVRPYAVQAGVVAVALLAVTAGLIALGAPPQAVEANDEPLAGFSAPRYLYSPAAERPLASANEAPLIVKAMVDANGRVYDYQVLSGAMDPRTEAALRQRLLTGVFQPARVFDHAVRGSILLTFGDVIVRA